MLHHHLFFIFWSLAIRFNLLLQPFAQISLVSIRSSVYCHFYFYFFYCFLRVGTYPCALQSQGSHSYPCSEKKFSLHHLPNIILNNGLILQYHGITTSLLCIYLPPQRQKARFQGLKESMQHNFKLLRWMAHLKC